ncbi:MAG: response regulator [Synechococcales bacterium]|nr:response regulator [Synechococcales bacterium]
MQLPSSSKVKILLVEDNPLNQRILLKQLEKLGYPCELATDGWAALTAIATAHYDIILMDCQMPELDGYDTALKIRQEEAHTASPPAIIIAITANSDQDSRAQAFAAGMDDFLSKPLSMSCLKFTLHRWIQRQGLDVISPTPVGGGATLDFDPRVALRDHLDRSQLALFSEHDEAFERSLIHLFLRDSHDRLHQLRVAAQDGDAAAVEHLAHALKGASASIGAGVICAIASNLESQARQQRLWFTHQQIDRLEASLQLIGHLVDFSDRPQPEVDAPQHSI